MTLYFVQFLNLIKQQRYGPLFALFVNYVIDIPSNVDERRGFALSFSNRFFIYLLMMQVCLLLFWSFNSVSFPIKNIFKNGAIFTWFTWCKTHFTQNKHEFLVFLVWIYGKHYVYFCFFAKALKLILQYFWIVNQSFRWWSLWTVLRKHCYHSAVW